MRVSVSKIEPVAGFDLDGRAALGDQTVEAGQALRHEVVLARRAGRLHGREDAAARAGDFLVAGALEAQLELVRPVAAEDEVGMAIHQARA